MKQKTNSLISSAMLGLVLGLGLISAAYADLTPDAQAKVDTYKKKLVEWAANPTIVAAAKESNAKGGLVLGMGNAKWDELADGDAVVRASNVPFG